MVEGASATDAIHRAFRNLYETAGSDYPTLRQHDGGSRHRTFVCGYHFIMFNISENAIANYVAGTGMTIVSVAMSAFMMLLEVLVSYIQALVFTMLSAVFISLAHVKSHEAEPEVVK